ncbi:hypothetical protein AB1M95_09410 [Sulfitobacter sp. LCG007]
MSKTPTKPNPDIGIAFSGDAKKGQQVQLACDGALEAIFGTDIPEMAQALTHQCFKALKADEMSDDLPANDERFFMLAAVSEIKPRDGVERMLAVQMAATHVAMIRAGRWLANAQTVEQVNAHYSGYTKLARAYSKQMEALRQHPNGGKQTVTVQHVNVSNGGQAIVGDVTHGGRVGNDK